jgi:2-oxoglutarate dehydrogenase E1 component
MTKDFGVNAGLVSELVGMYLHDRSSVDEKWRSYFDALLGGGELPLPRLAGAMQPSAAREGDAALPARETLWQAIRQAGVTQLVSAYRERGHLLAQVDPLGLLALEAPPALKDFDLSTFSLSEDDLDKSFPTVDLPGPRQATLREIVERLRATYCRSIGVEFRDIEEPEQRAWLQEKMESSGNRLVLSQQLQQRILARLTDAEQLETFLHKNFIGAKRFSIQGAESLIPMLDLLIDAAGEFGAEEMVLGMAHRGRLNVLVNIMGKDASELFAQFLDNQPEAHLGSGDVKYHLGHSSDRVTTSGSKVHLTLAFNPSHLEFVNPVVEGRVRAKQDRRHDDAHGKVVPLLIHGDAAFIGQGVNLETLNMARLDGYTTGGTIHVVVNNQVGFTTQPRDSRSTRYATDLARTLRVPVFHVNGEDLEAVAHVARLAAEYRQKFNADVVVDIYCYRRYGHNEGDEPRFTQPVMYAAIDKKPSIRTMFAASAVSAGAISQAAADEMSAASYKRFADALEHVRTHVVSWVPHSMGGLWAPYKGGPDREAPEVETKVPAETLISLAKKLAEIPAGFSANPKVQKVLEERASKLANGEYFDWGTGESMAFASLLAEGVPVRLSGQDARRGTFTHRHAVLTDAQSGARYSPYDKVTTGSSFFQVWDSPLSEAGVLGFDYGYSLDYPDALVMWEGQFGDFANGAQVIIDQFISSGEDKWRRLSGIVMLLPHGYEGQGPEHSSARLERFLQLAAEDNWQVCNLTSPAQLFHALRRQIHRPWRKPLVVMTPKSQLRLPAASSGIKHFAGSTLKDLSEGRFQRVIADVGARDAKKVKKVLLCSGKVYFDLAETRDKLGRDDVAIVRLEQLYPLDGSLDAALAPYAAGTPVVWVQEEPWNMGGWYFVKAHIGPRLEGKHSLACVSRDESASPATGSPASHKLEHQRLMERAFG